MLLRLVESGQFTSWVFGERIRSADLLASFGTVGDGLDNAMMEPSALGYRTPIEYEPLSQDTIPAAGY
ncbi:hypothetical protein ACWDBW_28555 [Streptomyces sp. NPDC001107]